VRRSLWNAWALGEAGRLCLPSGREFANVVLMKSAYELAMERLSKSAPTQSLSAAQKAELAELESLYKSRLAQLDLGTQRELTAAGEAGDEEKLSLIRAEFVREKARLEAERDAKKDRVRDHR